MYVKISGRVSDRLRKKKLNNNSMATVNDKFITDYSLREKIQHEIPAYIYTARQNKLLEWLFKVRREE